MILHHNNFSQYYKLYLCPFLSLHLSKRFHGGVPGVGGGPKLPNPKNSKPKSQQGHESAVTLYSQEDMEKVADDFMIPHSDPTPSMEIPMTIFEDQKAADTKLTKELNRFLHNNNPLQPLHPKTDNVLSSFNPLKNITNYFLKINNLSEDTFEFALNKITAYQINSEKDLKNFIELIKKESQEGILTIEQIKSLLIILRCYIVDNGINFENAIKFLEIWNKYNFEFASFNNIDDLKKKNKEELAKRDILSYQDKMNYINNQKPIIVEKMQQLFENYKDNEDEILKSSDLDLWYNYIEKRGDIIPLTAEEKKIYLKLSELKTKSIGDETKFSQNTKDDLAKLKEKSSLPKNLQNETPNKYYLPEDYLLEINNLKEMIEILENNKNLSDNDLLLCAIHNKIATIDAEGTIKLTSATYKKLSNYKELLNFKYADTSLERDYVLKELREKRFVIANAIDPIPNTIIHPAHLSHKTLIIRDPSGKEVFIRISFCTSSGSKENIKIDDFQITNEDPDKRNKKQMLCILSTFFLIDNETEPVSVDMEMTLLFQGRNTAGKNIIEDILIPKFSAQAEKGIKNSCQLTFTIDHEMLHKLCIIFAKNLLEKLENDLILLQKNLSLLSLEENIQELKMLKQEKEKENKEREYQRFFSSLNETQRKLYLHLKFFEKIMKEQFMQRDKQEKKRQINEEMKRKKEEEAEKAANKPKTAKEIKDEYIKNNPNKENDKEIF